MLEGNVSRTKKKIPRYTVVPQKRGRPRPAVGRSGRGGGLGGGLQKRGGGRNFGEEDPLDRGKKEQQREEKKERR